MTQKTISLSEQAYNLLKNEKRGFLKKTIHGYYCRTSLILNCGMD
ncbi:MAG: hypothetical protein ACTSRT_21125 [Promethearchaeota archaeon]